MLKINQEIEIRPFAILPDVTKRAIIVAEDSDYYIAEYCIGTQLKTFSFIKFGYEEDWQVRV